MKTRLLALLLLLVTALVWPGTAPAADDGPKADLDRIVGLIKAKLKDGKKSPADLAPELAEFDKVLAKYKEQKTDDVANIAYMKAVLYLQVFQDETKGAELLKQLSQDFPGTKFAKNADAQVASMKAQENMAVGKQFPDFAEKDLEGKPLSIAGYKGKVLLVDFWATWCGPCIRELPNVKTTYEKYQGKGFDILGISLDSDKDKLTGFLAKNEMPWKQFFDGQGWKNKLAQQYGINSIPATYLLDASGKVIAKNLRGPELEAAVAKALGKDK
ncbi:hypothetical protein LBMAG56_50210 [Verrucomicrobiota bacterium]|nr:hypothetical protein LBMAG56_50210 [Verrucomicrobiota bacterium]